MTLRQGSRFGFWNAMPAIFTGPRTLSPKRTMSPESGSTSPVTIFIKELTAARGAHHRGEFATAHVEARVPQGENAAAGAAVGQRDVIDIDGGGHATSPGSSPAQAGDPVVAFLPLSHHRGYWMPRLRRA